MKNGSSQIVGKTITGVIIKQAKSPSATPQSQLYLLFSDNSYFEFYSFSGSISNTGGCLPNSSFREVYEYMKEQFDVVFHAVQDPDSNKVAYSGTPT